MGCPARRGALTLPFRRENVFSRVYRGFFLSGNRLAVVLSHEKIFLGGYPRIFGGFFSKIFKIQKKFLDFRFFDFYGVFIYGEYESERFEPFRSDFDRVSGVLPPLEGEGTKMEGYPQIQSTVENYLLGLYPPKCNRLCPRYSSNECFLN